ncbi:3-oxosteroid 1-dehydrogenase [Moelleriella libera RCEF 2490]|uniref:3-oxosteroid 1-dehydrogenase n=1 Tax=Moelleriella libera RCEF 2490 TaxID=1081109 RepID=A0A162MB74_9HYPO|nr:3-oxosteroid 1-dehydrogenase [Moelleriella libera RCEF 2490]
MYHCKRYMMRGGFSSVNGLRYMSRSGRWVPGYCLVQTAPSLRRAASTTTAAAPPEETDLLIIGSGAGAMTAALRARSHGLRVIIAEKEKEVGGTSAISGGGLWIPCNPVSQAAGVKDSEEAALKYFEQAVGDVGAASSLERRRAFLHNGPRMVQFLQELGCLFHLTKGYPDYYPYLEGAIGRGGGRAIETLPFDMRKLKAWQYRLPPPTVPLAILVEDAEIIMRVMSSPSAFLKSGFMVLKLAARALMGQKLASMGQGLVARLLHLNLENGTDIRPETALTDIIRDESGGVVGARLTTSNGVQTITASGGVVLAAGGFAQNKEMREKYGPSPASVSWTSSRPGDTGDAISLGMKMGAATALLDDAWWGPTIIDPTTGKVYFTLSERARPHSMIVDASGNRFMNEAQSYTDAGHDQYARNKVVSAIPAWLIVDTNHRNKYILSGLFPRMLPKKALASKNMFMDHTLEGLAGQIGVDAAGLQATVKKYNGMCSSGVDADFGKGNNAYDNYFGDPKCKPNPNMGPLEKAPYYAFAVWPGDLGTKGGLLTDENQRVVTTQGSPIPGLFAIGNTAASVMGRKYLGPGSTIGPAMTHGFIAADSVVKDVAEKRQRSSASEAEEQPAPRMAAAA